MKYISLCLLLVLSLVSCDSPKHLSSDEFLAKAKSISTLNSASWVSYLGEKGGKVYLEHGNMITLSEQPSITVYWTEMNDLPESIKLKIISSEDPWIEGVPYSSQ